MKNKYFHILTVFILLSAVSFAQSTFSSTAKDARNQATFESNAPLEDIVGVSNGLTTKVTLNLNDITKSPKGNVLVDLAALKTGIDLRDSHLRSANWLNTEKYPSAEFVLTEISGASAKELIDGKEVKATAKGKLSIHGVTKEVTASIDLVYYKETSSCVVLP